MSRSCHSATFSSAGLRVAAQHPRQPGDLLGLDRVALVGHRARALLARRERLRDLAHLGALPGGGSRWRSAPARRRPARSPAAARRGGRGRRPGSRPARARGRAAPARAPRSPARSPSRCRPRPRPRRPPPGRTRARAARALRCGLEGEAGQLDPERRRLGVDAVGAPDAQRVDVFARLGGQRRDELRARRGATSSADAAQLQRQRRCRARRTRSARSGSSARPGRPTQSGRRRRRPCRGR